MTAQETTIIYVEEVPTWGVLYPSLAQHDFVLEPICSTYYILCCGDLYYKLYKTQVSVL